MLHPLEIVALLVLAPFIAIILVMGVLAFWIVFFDIPYKGEESRLIRWPAAIKSFWIEFCDFVDIVTNGHRARKTMRKIWASEND